MAPATCRAPPPARRLPSQPRMQPGGWNRTEGASTPPLSPRFPNDRGGKFTSREGVAFCWVHLTPRRRLPSLGSPSPPASPGRRLHLHLETRKPDLGHLLRRVRPGACSPSCPGVPEPPAVAGAPLTSGGGASSRAPYWVVGLPGVRCIHAAAGDTLPRLCCIPPAWESEPASARRGRVRECVCASVCICECGCV